MISPIPFDSLVSSRWKNGAGSKRDIAIGHHPDGAMAWMFGIADIERDAPFSSFPGARRWFSVIGAGQVELSIQRTPAERSVVQLDSTSDPYAFPGDLPTECRLLSDPVRVFNVMTSGGPGEVTVRRARAPLDWHNPQGSHSVVLVVSGSAEVTEVTQAGDGTRSAIGLLDCVAVSGEQRLRVTGTAELMVARVSGIL